VSDVGCNVAVNRYVFATTAPFSEFGLSLYHNLASVTSCIWKGSISTVQYLPRTYPLFKQHIHLWQAQPLVSGKRKYV
jgi:hypothetical protein